MSSVEGNWCHNNHYFIIIVFNILMLQNGHFLVMCLCHVYLYVATVCFRIYLLIRCNKCIHLVSGAIYSTVREI